ncbi:unnamed protein product [Chilo suppressalis]|uniref:Uncharacterized protein n=1 Tax=Chilo suppressalis TaxID=168631 RepID=A0ABN8B4E2_CHISP|nr:hypothetical protein evm_000274 [Chilo suppressalis]CAH0404123.1 unnamed protein product [Chilo suppressalis]
MLPVLVIVIIIPQCLCKINVDISPLEKDLSIDTYASLNMTKGYKKFDLTELEALGNMTRRLAFFRYYWFHPKHYKTYELVARNCYLSAQTYQSALEEIRKYYHIRFLYSDNLQYEVGYLVHEIVHKYQMMLELYHLVVKRFLAVQDKHFAPVTYMLYMYTNVLEYSMAVIHLCNMLHELEKKYQKKKKISVFDNDVVTQMTRASRGPRNVTVTLPPREPYEGRKETYLDRQAAERKRKRKQMKKDRQQMIISGDWKRTTVNKRPKKGMWPLEYGWSIEYW